MRVLIIGGTGLLGKALLQGWTGDEVIATGSRDADIRDETQVQNLVSRCRPDWTILAAAYTDVDGCEKNPVLAHAVNCGGAANVARVAREYGSRLMLISTDYVFDGAKSTPYEVNDPVSPINVYGKTKAAAEAAVRENLPDCCIVRTAWLFGVDGKCFPNTILALARERKELLVVADQRGSPTFNRDLARAIVELTRVNAEGTVHATNSGDCTWFEFAQALSQAANLAQIVVKPISTEELPRPAKRPKYSALSHASLWKYGISMRPWQRALKDYLDERLDKIWVVRRQAATASEVLPTGSSSGEGSKR